MIAARCASNAAGLSKVSVSASVFLSRSASATLFGLFLFLCPSLVFIHTKMDSLSTASAVRNSIREHAKPDSLRLTRLSSGSCVASVAMSPAGCAARSKMP